MGLHIRADPARARALSTEVNTRLLSSLRYVFDEAGRQLNVDVVAESEWLDRLAIAHRPKPLIHALFHALVRHIENADLKTACEIAKLLLGLEPAATSDEFHIVSFDDDCLGLGACALYRQFADTEE